MISLVAGTITGYWQCPHMHPRFHTVRCARVRFHFGMCRTKWGPSAFDCFWLSRRQVRRSAKRSHNHDVPLDSRAG